MPAKFNETKKGVLVAFYQFIRESDGKVWLDASDVEPYCDASISRSFVQLILQTLENEGNLEGEEDTDGHFVRFTLTAKGIGQAEKAAEELGVWESFEGLRTSVNAIVELGDAKTAEAKEVLDQLAASLRTGNDTGNLSTEEIQSAIVEVSALREMLNSAKIRAGVMALQARQTLQWIATQAAKTAVGELAKRALNLVLTLLGYN